MLVFVEDASGTKVLHLSGSTRKWTSHDTADNPDPQNKARSNVRSGPNCINAKQQERVDSRQSRKSEFRYVINLAFVKVEPNLLFTLNFLRLDCVIRSWITEL